MRGLVIRVGDLRLGRLMRLAMVALATLTCDADQRFAPNSPAPVASQAAVELLIDGAFEAGGAAWQNHDASGRSVSGAATHGGSLAQTIQGSASGDLVVFQEVSVAAGGMATRSVD